MVSIDIVERKLIKILLFSQCERKAMLIIPIQIKQTS